MTWSSWACKICPKFSNRGIAGDVNLRWASLWPVFVHIFTHITSQVCITSQEQRSIWHKSCRPLSRPDSSLGKCYVFFHWIILCSLPNKPCDLSLFLLKQTEIAALFYPTARDMLATSQHSGSANPGSGMSRDGAGEFFPGPKAQLSRFLLEQGIWRKTGHTRSIVLQIPYSYSSHRSL